MEDSRKKIRFSTGTMMDMVTGKYEPGYGNGFYLNGGLGTCTTGLHGRGNTYKSTLFDSWIIGMMRLYPEMRCFIFDTEFSKEKERLVKFSRGARYGDEDVSKRIALKSDPEWTIEKITSFMHKICDEREAHAKDLRITTPFFDGHGDPVKMMLPTVIYIDSWSELTSQAINKFLKEKGLGDDKFRTLYMENGNRKTLLLSLLNQMASRYGLIICATARTGDNRSMNHLPPPKELTHQRNSDKIKDVGSKFTTLVHVLAQIRSCKNLLDANKEAFYPHGDTAALDIQELQMNTSRNKSNMSGPIIPMIVSQEHGLLNEVSNFHFLREYGGEGLLGNPRSYASAWMPDVKFNRKNLRSSLDDNYELGRALELTARYQYVKMSWNTGSLPVMFDATAEQLFEKLTSSEVPMTDILQSTSAWAPITTTSKKPKPGFIPGAGGRTHMSLFEVLRLAGQAR